MNYDNTNRGILSRNDRKEKDTHPDFKGTINVGGVDYWLSGWIKQKNDGTGKFFSLSLQPKEQQDQAKSQSNGYPPMPQRAAPQMRQASPQSTSGFSDMDSDVPF